MLFLIKINIQKRQQGTAKIQFNKIFKEQINV